MPYIAEEHRTDELNGAIVQLAKLINNTKCTDGDGKFHPGILNYSISVLISELLSLDHVSYSNLNKMVGVLECVKIELYRRVAGPYEDKMISNNGDVYPDV